MSTSHNKAIREYKNIENHFYTLDYSNIENHFYAHDYSNDDLVGIVKF